MVLFESPFEPVPIVNKPFAEIILTKLWQHSIKYPRKKAIISAENEDQYFTYSDIYLYSLSVASFLQQHGFEHGDVVGLVMPNSLYYAPIFIGCTLRGGTITAASVSNTHYELERQFTDASVKFVFCSNDALENVLKATKKLPIKKIIVIDANENTTFSNSNIFNISQVFITVPLPNLPPVNINLETDALILPYSSGTTGAPKGVVITHKGFGTHANIYNSLMENFVKNVFIKKPYIFDQELELILLPINHMFGCCVLFHCLMMAKTVVLMKQFEPEPFFEAIEKYKIRILMIHPPVLIMLSKHSAVDKYDLSSIEIIFSGAAPAGKDIIEDVKQKHPNLKQVTQGYGTTECLGVTFPDNENIPNGSVGKVVPLGKAKVIDVETGKELSYNQPGEILFISPTVTPGYLNRPEATKESIDAEGWYHTGIIIE
uniref:AMP-dependent synthetase/ligase domain-containing protein n=1 Tax=Panagrolaimus davidi TaxID=227884 RepID=A0A914PCU0_9BILA